MIPGTSEAVDHSNHSGTDCEREFLSFEVLTEGLPEETSQLIQHIKEVAESVLFHWKTFPIVLPTPVAVFHETPSLVFCGSGPDTGDQNEGVGSESNGGPESQRDASALVTGRVRPLVLREVFVTPSFDELDAVAVDAKGEPQKLTSSHLSSLRQKGEFEVQSLHFPGQNHRWRVSECLQKGRDRTHEAFLDDIAMSASFLIIVAKNRWNGETFSIRQALNSIWNGILMLLDLSCGIQWVQAHNLESRIKEERCSYLVQELTAKDGDVEGLCSWILQQVKRATREKFRLCGTSKQPYVPYNFTTPQGQELNLKLFNRELMKKIIPVLVGILEKESRGWFLHFRENVVSQLKSQGLGDAEIEKEGNKLVQEEYLKRVYRSIESNQVLQDFGEDIPRLLIDQARAVLLMHQAIDEVERIYEEGEKSRRQELSHTQPILSRISLWLLDNLSATHDTLMEQHKWRPHEHALALCRQEGLLQHSYFLQRDLAFMREREPVLLKELQNIKVATRVFQWRTQIWFPGKYIVRRSFQGESEIMPTILALAPTNITTPRSDPTQPVYLLEKQIIRTTSTRWPFWRWFNFLHRSWAWTCNALFFFAVWLPLCSPFSLRALFSQDPFMADFELSQVNGTVCPSKASLTPTLTSRLTNLWRHISKSRTHFETMPDTGFIGKGVSRHVNRMWNYILKGIVGTLLLTTIFPVICIIVSVGSLVVAACAPVWGPASVALVHIFFILLYDFDSASGQNKFFPLLKVVLWNFLCLGVLQPLLAAMFALCICPALALIVVIFAVTRRCFCHLWDEVMFHCVIKKRGRVPASDSILVKRVAGPGLHDNFVYQISFEQALAAFEARLELDELAIFEREMEERISEPLIVYGEFVQRCFGPFSGILGRWGNFGLVEKEVRDLNQALYEIVEKRKNELALGLPVSVRSKVKMTTRDLKLALKQAVIVLEEFYPQKVFSRVVKRSSSDSSSQGGSSRDSDLFEEINTLLRQGLMGRVQSLQEGVRKDATRKEEYESVEAWWDARGLPVGDYVGLASLIYTEIFSPEFLTPLDDKDTIFQMEVQGINLSRYTEMIRCLPERVDLDEKLTVHTSRGNIQIHAPYLELSSFTPLVRHSVPTHKTEKASLAARLSLRLNPGGRLARALRVPEKLMIPPPVPHPAHISVIIHNRDAAEPIALEDTLTKQVLRTVEDSAHAVPAAPKSDFDGDNCNQCDSYELSESENASVYDDPSLYSRPSQSQTDTHDRRKRRSLSALGRSRTATLEMTETLERVKSIDSRSSRRKDTQDRNRSSTLESLPRRCSGWLSSPLRALLEGQRPFSVALNLAAAEDDTSPSEEDEETFPSLSYEPPRLNHSVQEQNISAHTTAV